MISSSSIRRRLLTPFFLFLCVCSRTPMATQSVAPPNPKDETRQNPVEDRQDVKAEAPKDISPTSVFVNSEPLREDQVQNGVNFLSHPKVKGSPVIYRRSFLERKGLKKEEIDEAFCRVPDPTPTISTGQPAVANQDGQLNPSSSIKEASNQSLQPAPATTSKVGTLAQSCFSWQQALLALGFLIVSGAGTAVVFKNAIVPRLKSWIRKVVSEEEDLVKITNSRPSLAEEAAYAAKAAAIAAADVAQASQQILVLKNEEKRYLEEFMSLLDLQVHEMKSMSDAIRNLGGTNSLSRQEENKVVVSSSKSSHANGKADFNLSSARPLSPPASVEPAPHPKSYMEIMAMIQRGEKPSNIREINDLPPNPNQPVPNPRVAPRPKPWEVGQVQNNLNRVLVSQDNGHVNYQSNGNSPMPWWRENNVRISEIESEDERKAGSYSVPTIELPVQRSWVPPQPPPVAMAGAAAAIRQPKKPAFQSEPLTDNQDSARFAESTEELQMTTEVFESDRVPEANSAIVVLNT